MGRSDQCQSSSTSAGGKRELRPIWSLTIANSHVYSEPISQRNAYGYFNANSNSYGTSTDSPTPPERQPQPTCNTDNDSNAKYTPENHSHTQSSSKSKGATYCATAPDARTDSNIATADSMAAAYLASSHNASAAPALATPYSRTSTLKQQSGVIEHCMLAPFFYWSWQ